MLNFTYIIDRSDAVIVAEKLKFRKTLFGGYNKVSVLKQIKKLEEEYMRMFEEECAEHERALKEKDQEIENLMRERR